MTKSIIVIPARYQSSRFPGKPLAMIVGKVYYSVFMRLHGQLVNSLLMLKFMSRRMMNVLKSMRVVWEQQW